MSTGRILIIAPNPDLRGSLAFALEAEGYEVTSHAVLLSPDEGRDYDCVVLDQKAAVAVPREVALDFCANTRRIVLLAASPQPWLLSKVFSVLQTPHLGEALTATVKAAIGAQSASAGAA